MKILITGGAGFVGKNLSRKLLSEGHEVILFDNLESGNKNEIPKGAKLIVGDVRKKSDLKKLPKSEAIIHLAAKISVPESLKNSAETFETNLLGTINVLDANRDASFIFASSAAVYGFQEKMPISENAETHTLSPYGLSKLFAEKYFDFFRDAYKTKISALRFFNIYGLGQASNQYAGVIVKFLGLAKSGKEIEIFGDGSQTRDFINVADICSAIESSIGKSGLWNIGSGKSVTVNELAETIKKLSGKDLKISHKPERTGDIKHSLADISKAGKELGWTPSISLESGLKELI